jgi:hypothetical protein
MTRLAGLISHLGGKKISNHDLEIFTHNAKDEAIELLASAMTKRVSTKSNVPTSDEKVVDFAGNSTTSQDPVQPPVKQKLSLKPGNFDPVLILETPPRNMDSTSPDQNDNKNKCGIYSKTVNGVGDGTRLITASFIKTNNKIRDQLLKNFNYFSELLCMNIDGLKIHPISSDKPLPILASAKDKICPPLAPRSGIISTSRITSPSTQECATNKQKKRKKLTPMAVANLMRTDNLMDLIGLLESCQYLLQVMSRIPLIIS